MHNLTSLYLETPRGMMSLTATHQCFNAYWRLRPMTRITLPMRKLFGSITSLWIYLLRKGFFFFFFFFNQGSEKQSLTLIIFRAPSWVDELDGCSPVVKSVFQRLLEDAADDTDNVSSRTTLMGQTLSCDKKFFHLAVSNQNYHLAVSKKIPYAFSLFRQLLNYSSLFEL